MALRSFPGIIARNAELDDYAATIDGLPGSPPLAHWRLGEASGTQIVDRKAGARHGAYSGTIGHGAAGLPASSDGAVDFAGTGYGEIPHDAGLALSAFSLSFWFRLNTLPSTEVGSRYALVSKDQSGLFVGDFTAWVESDGDLIVQFQDASAQYPISFIGLQDNTTYHVVVRADSTGFDFYVNGEYGGKRTDFTGAWSNNTQPLRLGAVPWLFEFGGSWPTDAILLDGILDEIAIYDRVISEVEVLTLAQYSQAPTANTDTFVIAEETTTVLNVVGNDQYAGQKAGLTVEVTSQPAFGTAIVRSDNDIDLSAGSVSQNEADSFSYRITDGFGQSNPATVSLTIQDAAAGGGGPGDDGLGGTLIYDWAPLASWPDLPPAQRQTGSIATDGVTSWWINGATVGASLVKNLLRAGSNNITWNRAPTGHPSLEIKTELGNHAALGLRLFLFNVHATNPRHLRVVFEIKCCTPSDPTTHRANGIGPTTGPYPDFRNTWAGIGGKFFGGQWMGHAAGGACQTNWYARDWTIGQGALRTGWTGGKLPKCYAYAYGRDTGCGESGALIGSRTINDAGIATGWFKLENEVRLNTPSLVNSTWGPIGTKPTNGDGFNKIFVTPDIDQEVGVPAIRELRAHVQNRVFNTSRNNYHLTANLQAPYFNLYYGGGDPAQANGWSWIRRVQVYHYPEDDV